MSAFVVLGLVSSVPCCMIGWKKTALTYFFC